MGIIGLLLLVFLTIVWVGLGIMLSKWKKQDEEKYKDERQDKRN